MYEKISTTLQDQLKAAPKLPGVYMFFSESGERLYIGKTVNLYNRSNSYFQNYQRLDPRLQLMVENAYRVEYITVDNEVEALLLETNLIKKYDPKYNVLLTDDKNYVWVKIFSKMDFPIIKIVREKFDDGADYFGPYPAKRPILRLLKGIRRLFPYRSCTRVIEMRGDEIYSSNPKPCLYYDLGLCNAPCTKNIPVKEYRQMVSALKRFLRSEHDDLKKELEQSMRELSAVMEYEAAAKARDRLRDLQYLTQFSLVDEGVDDDSIRQRQSQRESTGLKTLLERLEIDPASKDLSGFRIECYDISNIQGTNATAAMVVSLGGKLSKSDYRKFKIKTKDSPDDFAMLQETLTRRLKYLLEDGSSQSNSSFNNWPGLIVIDGGKGQLSSVVEILNSYGGQISQIPVVGLAKKDEEIFLPVAQAGGQLGFKRVKLSRHSPALHIVQQLRDEAHRFGLGYHRTLRSKAMIANPLDDIPGVGEVTKKNLLLAFGSIAGIKKASVADIEAVVRNKSTARKILKLLK
jgi:excinuclease ABC subunit C